MIALRRVGIGTVAFVFGMLGNAAAQECLGISAGSRGYASYGVEGTDGVTGQALTVGLTVRDFSLQLHGRRMDPGGTTFSGGVVGRMHTLQLQAAHPITKKLPLCIFGGFGWTGYNMERENVNSPYTQLRAPLGISLGKEFKLTDQFSVSTFVQNAALFDVERFERGGGFTSNQFNLGVGMAAGLGLSYGPLMLRSTISNYKTLRSSPALYNDFPYMSLQLGVKF